MDLFTKLCILGFLSGFIVNALGDPMNPDEKDLYATGSDPTTTASLTTASLTTPRPSTTTAACNISVSVEKSGCDYLNYEMCVEDDGVISCRCFPGYTLLESSCIAYNAFSLKFVAEQKSALKVISITEDECYEKTADYVASVMQSSTFSDEYIGVSTVSCLQQPGLPSQYDVVTNLMMKTGVSSANEDNIAAIFVQSADEITDWALSEFSCQFEPQTCADQNVLCSQHAKCMEADDTHENAYCNCSSEYLDPYQSGNYDAQGVFCVGNCEDPNCSNSGHCETVVDPNPESICKCDPVYHGKNCEKSYAAIIISCCMVAILLLTFGSGSVVLYVKKHKKSLPLSN